ncbi:thioesterase II family protein [Streptomyces sp. NPDC021100]|uniref:thioesterase II family protein n=1 Tax=Streptomyces sp. NPDC021100 TaxID=3365114 RepID=UPI00378C07BA
MIPRPSSGPDAPHVLRLPENLRRPHAAVRLYCIPFIGASADFYLPLAHALPGWVEARPVELPGYSTRRKGSGVQDERTVADDLTDVITTDIGEHPFALFGHCSGGLVAFETVRRLEQSTGHRSRLLAASAIWPPPLVNARVSSLTVRQLHQLSMELAGQRALRQVTVRAVAKRDFLFPLRYRYQDGAPVTCPISAFTGQDDPIVPPESLHGWSSMTHHPTRSRIYPGRHFWLTRHWPDLARNLAHDLGAAVR